MRVELDCLLYVLERVRELLDGFYKTHIVFFSEVLVGSFKLSVEIVEPFVVCLGSLKVVQAEITESTVEMDERFEELVLVLILLLDLVEGLRVVSFAKKVCVHFYPLLVLLFH